MTPSGKGDELLKSMTVDVRMPPHPGTLRHNQGHDWGLCEEQGPPRRKVFSRSALTNSRLVNGYASSRTRGVKTGRGPRDRLAFRSESTKGLQLVALVVSYQ